jgi:hypothetical protein
MAVAFSDLRAGRAVGTEGPIRRRDAALVGRGRRPVRAGRHTGGAGQERRDRRANDDGAVWKSAGRADDAHGRFLRRVKGCLTHTGGQQPAWYERRPRHGRRCSAQTRSAPAPRSCGHRLEPGVWRLQSVTFLLRPPALRSADRRRRGHDISSGLWRTGFFIARGACPYRRVESYCWPSSTTALSDFMSFGTITETLPVQTPPRPSSALKCTR